jgi:enterochelin esterase-like enzyme
MKLNNWLTFVCISCYLFLLLKNPVSAQERESRFITDIPFQSQILDRDVNYGVYLPENYDSLHTTYPVIYLLNGYGGNEKTWIYTVDVKQKVDSLIKLYLLYPCIIIMPDGLNSYFVNSIDGKMPYEDFFHKEFIPYTDSVYHISSNKKLRAVGGFSMGGFGALIHGIKYPGTFGTCIALGAAVRTDSMVKHTSPGLYEQYLSPVFGNLPPELRITNYWKANNPLYLIDSTNATILSGNNWYIDCGMYDYLYEGNKAFHELLMRYRIPHEYHMRIGAHTDKYWNISFIYGILFWNDQLKKYFMENASLEPEP